MTIMETVTIKYNPADAVAQAILDLIRKVKSITIVEDSSEYVPNKETLQAIEDIKNGKVYHAANADDLFKQILG